MEEIQRFIFNRFRKLIKFPKSEKFYLLNYIKAISKSGKDEKISIKNKIYEYKMRGKYILAFILEEVKNEIDSGKRFAVALRNAGVINEREFHILINSKGGLAAGIEKIIETSQKSHKSLVAFMLLIIPPSIMLLALLFSHGMVKDILDNMLEPIRSAGGTPPPIKDYLLDPTTYIVVNIVYFSVLTMVIIGYFVLKKFFPKKFFKYVPPIIEEEYTLDILKSLKTVMSGGGINISNAAKALANGEPDNIKKLFFETIVDRTTIGKKELSTVFEEFNMNYNTISSLKIGEDSNNIEIGMDIAIEELEQRYERDISLFLKIGMWGGQFAMIGIAGKPMIDIMLLMSVGQLNFKV